MSCIREYAVSKRGTNFVQFLKSYIYLIHPLSWSGFHGDRCDVDNEMLVGVGPVFSR